MEQLRFEGPEFARTLTNTGAVFKRVFEDEMRAMLKQTPILLFDIPEPPPRLFEPPPRCPKYYELDDQALVCNLADGHSGEHWDAMGRIWWREG